MEFKDRLKELRKQHNMTQKKLAELLGYGYTAIANYESGRNQPSIKDLKRIVAIFNVSMDYLLGLSDVAKPYLAESIEWKEIYDCCCKMDKENFQLFSEQAQWFVERSRKKYHSL